MTFASTSGQLLQQALPASLLLRPRGVAAPLGGGAFVLAGVAMLLVGIAIDTWRVPEPREFNHWALTERSFPLLVALAAGLFGSALIRRPALALRLAAVGLLATLPIQLVDALWPGAWPLQRDDGLFDLVACAYLLALSLRVLSWAAVGQPRWRPALGALLAAGIAVANIALLPGSPWWWPAEDDSPLPFAEPTPRDYSAEALLYAQPALLQQAIDALRPQQPGRIDLYALGFAGDGMESVFRNEVEHFERLVSQRFDSPQRTLTLINHPDSIGQHPLATLSNLRIALQALGQRMDPDEDILLLFLTSHGSAEHELHVALDDLPLDPIAPADLANALEDAGIRWRVLIVSACYSGGFIDALADPDTLIITAARADRASFGCGAASEITWFGQALLAEALNETLDFGDAFALAKQAVRVREREQEETPSHPQIRLGEQIAPRLATWRQQLTPGPVVPFAPAPPAAADLTPAATAESR